MVLERKSEIGNMAATPALSFQMKARNFNTGNSFYLQ